MYFESRYMLSEFHQLKLTHCGMALATVLAHSGYSLLRFELGKGTSWSNLLYILVMTKGQHLLFFQDKRLKLVKGQGHCIDRCVFQTRYRLNFLCRLRSIAAHRDHFVRRLSVRPSVCLSVCLSGSHTFLVVTHSYVSQATHAFLGMLPLCFMLGFRRRGGGGGVTGGPELVTFWSQWNATWLSLKERATKLGG